MSLMFAKQFSEAGVTGTGLMAKSKRGKRDQDDAGDSSSGGLFNMEGSGPYRTHMLFPGRKDEETTADPRRSSGSPGFMKTMMSWGKRPSDPRASSGQEFTRLRSPQGTAESEFDFSFDPLSRKTVSFHEGVSNQLSSYPVPYPTNQLSSYPVSNQLSSYPVSYPTNQDTGGHASYVDTYPTNHNGVVAPYTYPIPDPTSQNGHSSYSYNEPYREDDYAHYGRFNKNYIFTLDQT